MSAHVTGEDALRGDPPVVCLPCDGLGFMAGAHTDRVNECPYCDGTGFLAVSPSPRKDSTE